jgi:hypothetical protein
LLHGDYKNKKRKARYWKMVTYEGLIRLLREYQEEQGLKGTCPTDCICEELGLDHDGLNYLLLCALVIELKKNAALKDAISYMEQEEEVYKKSMADLKASGREKQEALVRNGLPIANKRKKSLMELLLYIQLGYTDKELLEYYGISKSTLRRWKIEAEKIKKAYNW